MGRLYYEPIKDRHGNILIVTIREVEMLYSFFNGKWMQISKLQSQRKSLSTPEEPTALDILLITIQVCRIFPIFGYLWFWDIYGSSKTICQEPFTCMVLRWSPEIPQIATMLWVTFIDFRLRMDLIKQSWEEVLWKHPDNCLSHFPMTTTKISPRETTWGEKVCSSSQFKSGTVRHKRKRMAQWLSQGARSLAQQLLVFSQTRKQRVARTWD